MAVQPGVNETGANDLVPASGVVPFVIEGPRARPIYGSIAWQLPFATLGSNVGDIPAWDASPATEETAEADEVVSVNYTTNKKSITGVMIATRALITDQIVQDAGALASTSVDEFAANIRNTIDVEVLELFKTASNLSDNTGVNLTIPLWAAALALFKAQKPGGLVVFVGSNAQLRDIHASMMNSAGGAQIMGAGSEIFNAEHNDGYLGKYNGVHIFESANVAQNDGANDVGGFVSIRAGAAGATPARSGLALGVWKGVGAEGVRVPSKFGLDTTISARVGFQRASERMVRGLISKRAAA